MSKKTEKLEDLKNLFLYQCADIDTGLYKYFNWKNSEISKFLDNMELPDNEDLACEILDALIDFFGQFYNEGFLTTTPRCNLNSDVKFVWNNMDQYYIKTDQYFKKYSFTFPKRNGITVHFKYDNIEFDLGNAQQNKLRRHLLSEKQFEYDAQNANLIIYFDFRRLTDDDRKIYGTNMKRTAINEVIVQELKNILPKDEIIEPIIREKKSGCELKKHINRFSNIPTCDFFIHKDLKQYLSKELDYYIRNNLIEI